MSGKPAARLSDPTACPIPGHGVNPIASGSPDVLFDNLSAARQGDSSACGGALVGNVIPNVLINGMPATTLGSIGNHGNVVTGGSGTVLIGTTHSAAAFSAPVALAIGSGAAHASATSAPNSLAPPTDTLERTWQEESGDPAPLGLEEEDEEEELEEQTQQGITLRVGFFFDGTGDNDANVARGAQCRANQLGYDAADERALLEYCPPHQMDPMSSYARQRTNIARLYDLYRDDSLQGLKGTAQQAFLRIYIEGAGTETDKPDQQFPDMALGTGDTGVLEKVTTSGSLFLERLKFLLSKTPNILITSLEIDVFGFSRGAAAARHFVNDLRTGSASVLAKALPV